MDPEILITHDEITPHGRRIRVHVQGSSPCVASIVLMISGKDKGGNLLRDERVFLTNTSPKTKEGTGGEGDSTRVFSWEYRHLNLRNRPEFTDCATIRCTLRVDACFKPRGGGGAGQMIRRYGVSCWYDYRSDDR